MKYNGVITLKINIQKLVRVITPLLSVLCVIVACIIPVHAVGLDYNDYITDITVNGDQDLITVSFPIDFFNFNLYTTTSVLLDSASGSSCLFDLPADVPVQLGFGPTFSINLDNIPSDTQFTVVFDTSIQHGFIDETSISYQGWFLYQKPNGGQSWVEVDGFRNSGILSIQGSLDSSYSSFSPYFYFYNFSANPIDGSSSVNFSLSVSSFQATFSISSLYRLQQETGKTNAILKEVEQQLADQGQKLDDIISGTSDQQNAADQFKDDVNGSVEDLDQFGNVMNNIPYPTIDTDSLVPEDIFYGSSYLTYISTIQEFWKSNTLSTVTLVLGSLLLISYVLFGEKG